MVDFKHPRSDQFFQFWKTIPREGLVPYRQDYHPEKAAALLPTMMMYELISADHIKIRLMGTGITQDFGTEREGKNYLDFIEPQRREKVSKALWEIARIPCGIRVVAEHLLQSGLTVKLESVGLPLLNREGRISWILFQRNILGEQRGLPEQPSDREFDPRTYVRLFLRDYIDIGAGVSDFSEETP
ncbi:PAS domain-containing protein [Kiloniella laminariae]|uniref:PAS domain-containing protein n=1 Tax=Kiloniella laminariae TaxID=454162 RepID=A0ABT4LF33_9PROT|nr:PAS domain-containing protein [Kiloniella laminariae]MCZ4279710.1 PAS domain-containing protein [Kiloniella laminariae]